MFIFCAWYAIHKGYLYTRLCLETLLVRGDEVSQQKKKANHILISQVICYFISVPK